MRFAFSPCACAFAASLIFVFRPFDTHVLTPRPEQVLHRLITRPSGFRCDNPERAVERRPLFVGDVDRYASRLFTAHRPPLSPAAPPATRAPRLSSCVSYLPDCLAYRFL
jgi:hypothetical protein